MSNVIIALFTLVAIVVAFRSQQHQAETESGRVGENSGYC